jgi:spectinomycin phosphotransferase
MTDFTVRDTGAVTAARLRAWVAEDFGVELGTVERVRLGADATAQLWRCVSIEGLAYAVKLSGVGTPAGLLVTAHLAQRGARGIAAPVLTRTGAPYAGHDGRLLSMVPWLSGRRALDGGMTERHWVSYGAVVAEVHESAPVDLLADALPREQHTHDEVAAAVRALDQLLAGETRRAAADRDPLTAALAREWQAARERIGAVLGGADDLAARLRDSGTPPVVVCHGDPHLGNLVLGEQGQVWLVDWDDTVLAPRERDLMFVLGGVLAFAPVTEEQQGWFFDGYGPVTPDPALVAYYQCTRALVDLADPAAEVLGVTRFSAGRREESLSVVRGVLSPTGLVDRALASVRRLG